MAGAHACAAIAMEVLVEQKVVPPQGIGLELLRTAKDRTPSLGVALEGGDQPGCQLVSDLYQVH